MSQFEDGSFLGATWAIRRDLPERVHFLVNHEHPDGDLLVPTIVLEADGRQIEYPATRVPVKVIFAIDRLKDFHLIAPPPLDVIRASWGSFKPVGDFQIPLPPSAQ